MLISHRSSPASHATESRRRALQPHWHCVLNLLFAQARLSFIPYRGYLGNSSQTFRATSFNHHVQLSRATLNGIKAKTIVTRLYTTDSADVAYSRNLSLKSLPFSSERYPAVKQRASWILTFLPDEHRRAPASPYIPTRRPGQQLDGYGCVPKRPSSRPMLQTSSSVPI